ncbi:MAG: protein kinase domain-containing protein, partial [Nannocystaceae bacterium]
MNHAPPPSALAQALTIVDGPVRAGSEQRWRVQLGDGRPAILGVLLPELAREHSVRRRYVRDVERQKAIAEALAPTETTTPAIAEIVAYGPLPDPRDPKSDPPWRVRTTPEGLPLDAWLARRAPAPIDEVCEKIAQLAELIHRVHAHGVVLRDLHPRQIICTGKNFLTLLDTGLSRVDVLSTRTAASLLLEGSPYASPEQLRHTTLDQRSDLFGLGVLLYQGLTGNLPFGDGPALLRQNSTPVEPKTLRAEIPETLNALILACLAAQPEARPESAASVAAVLRGQNLQVADTTTRTSCQNCGAPLRLGQRLCMGCGREAVVFHRAKKNADASYSIDLTKATEDTDFVSRLSNFLEAISDGPVPSLNLLIGDHRMYSKTEQKNRRKLPLRLVSNVTHASAQALMARFEAEKFKVRLVHDQAPGRFSKAAKVGLGVTVGGLVVVLISLAAAGVPFAQSVIAFAISCLVAVAIALTIIAISRKRKRKRKRQPSIGFVELRASPAALPASDPLVSTLASQLTDATAADVREQIGEMALLIQRLV